MSAAGDIPPQNFVGKRVAFRVDEVHADCWHARNGLKSGMVLRLGQSLSQKAALLAAEELSLPESLPEESERIRVWVKVDPCTSYPRGCEVAVEIECLTLL
jgi:hypothetical protein